MVHLKRNDTKKDICNIMATSITSRATCAHGNTTTGTTNTSSKLTAASRPISSLGVTPITLNHCNWLLWNQLSFQLHSLKRAGCYVEFRSDCTSLYGANAQVIYIYLKDCLSANCLDMVYATRTLRYLDLATATVVSVMQYIHQFAHDLSLIAHLWEARSDYRVKNHCTDIPGFQCMVEISIANFGDVPSVWGHGDTIPSYNMHSDYFSESGLYDLYCAFPRK